MSDASIAVDSSIWEAVRRSEPERSSSACPLARVIGWIVVTAMLTTGSLAEAGRPRPGPVWKAGVPPALTDVSTGVSSTSIVFNGELHVFSYDPVDGNLHHATWDRAAWSSEIIDGADGSDVGIGPSAVIWKGSLNVFYGDATHNTARRARRSASATAWTLQEIATQGGGETATVLDQGSPHVFYHDVASGDLRHTFVVDNAWVGGTRIDGGSSSVAGSIHADLGAGVSAVQVEGEPNVYYPHVFYYDATNGDLRHASFTSSGWQAETVDGEGGSDGRIDANVGADSSAVVVDLGPQVFYFDATNGNLRRARWNGETWMLMRVDGYTTQGGRINGVVGTGTSARSHHGTPYVAYHDATNGDLRLAWIVSGAWRFTTLDGNGTNDGRTTDVVGLSTSIVSYYGNLHVFSEMPATSPAGSTRLRRSWLNDPELTVNVLSDSMLAPGAEWWAATAAELAEHADLRIGTHWGVSGTTAVSHPYLQNPAVTDGRYASQPADVLLVSFAFNDLNPRPFWGANADPATLAWAQLIITENAREAGYRCVVWFEQRSDFDGELVTRHGFTASEAATLEPRLADNRSNLSLLRSTYLEQEPEFRVGLVDWAGHTNGPTDESLFSDGLHPSAAGGKWIGEEASKAMADCD